MNKYLTHTYTLDSDLNMWIEFSELENKVSFIGMCLDGPDPVSFESATTDQLDTIISALNDIRNMLWKIENPAEVSE